MVSDVSWTVCAWLAAPDGRRTPLPAAFRWSVEDRQAGSLEVVVEPDTPLIYGLGTVWMGGATFRGCFRGEAISGRACIEHTGTLTTSRRALVAGGH